MSTPSTDVDYAVLAAWPTARKIIEQLETQQAELRNRISRTDGEVTPEKIISSANGEVAGTSLIATAINNGCLVTLMNQQLETVTSTINFLSANPGQAGICTDCQTAIDPERLDCMPKSTRCCSCQSKAERSHRRLR